MSAPRNGMNVAIFAGVFVVIVLGGYMAARGRRPKP